MTSFVWYAALPAFVGGTGTVRHLLADRCHDIGGQVLRVTSTDCFFGPAVECSRLLQNCQHKARQDSSGIAEVWLLAAALHLLTRRKARACCRAAFVSIIGRRFRDLRCCSFNIHEYSRQLALVRLKELLFKDVVWGQN